MGPFDETITWIRFRTDLRQAPPTFWLLLGECVAVTKHLKGAPLPPVESHSLNLELRAYGLLARMVLDGSTLRAEQVLQHLKGGVRVPASQSQDLVDLENLYTTTMALQAMDPNTHGSITPDRILALYGELIQTTNKKTRPFWRTEPMPPGSLPGVPAEMIPLFMVELCDWLNGPELQPPTPDEAPHYALLRSLITELYLAWIQPVATAGFRLAGLVSQILLTNGGLSGAWTYLPAVHYHRTRPEFLRQIAHAAQGVGDPIPFMAYGLQGLQDGLKELAQAIRNAQTFGQWQAYVEDLFSDEKGPMISRQRQLLLALGEEMEPVPSSTISVLTPELARLYASVSSKTLQRDLDALEDLGALQRSPEGFRARRELVLGFKG